MPGREDEGVVYTGRFYYCLGCGESKELIIEPDQIETFGRTAYCGCGDAIECPKCHRSAIDVDGNCLSACQH